MSAALIVFSSPRFSQTNRLSVKQQTLSIQLQPGSFHLLLMPFKSATLSRIVRQDATAAAWRRIRRFPAPRPSVPLQLRGHPAVSGGKNPDREVVYEMIPIERLERPVEDKPTDK